MHSTPSAPTPSTRTNAAPGSCSPSSTTSRGCSPRSTPWTGRRPRSRSATSSAPTVGSPTRTIQVLPAAADLPFPHVNQVWLIERYIADPDGTPRSAVAALGVTNLHPDNAAPERLASLVRRHWGIESLHWLRDSIYREDDSTARTRAGPRIMAALRNLSIGAHHLTGRRDIAEATRAAGRDMTRPFQVLKLT